MTEERNAHMFPRLTAAQIERIARVGKRRRVTAGELVFEAGDHKTAFFVVVTGALEILRPTDTGETRVVLQGPGEFTGEINMLSGRSALVRARVAQDGELIEVDRDHLRELVQRDFELSEIFMRAFILRRVGLVAAGTSSLVLIGSRHSASTMTLRAFLTRNAQPFTYEEVEGDPAVQELLDRFHVSVNEVPVVICSGGRVFRNPSVESLAQELGLSFDLDAATLRDVVIVGAGPAGLASAVYAASEGLDVLVLEGTAPGGQAGTSSRIENYLGFPTGISGQELAGRAFTQAEKFGATLAIGRRAARIDCDARPYKVILEDGEVVHCRALIIATGVKYRKPALPDLARFESTGVFYSATHLEAQLCEKEPVIVVGGGNSAGQAAVFLSNIASHVRVLVRGPGLAESMSRYLIQRLGDCALVTITPRTQIEALEGTDGLEAVRCRQLDTGVVETLPVRHVFMMTGADPHTKWLEGCVRLDDKGFVKTGLDLTADDLRLGHWPLERPPYALETTIPGVFAVGDARSGSTKRVASAVGEGAMCVQLLHRALAGM
ncbi:MAG: cyclic nucleotide-regulated FAD-dependent pyridine nucleotide-disulfide oxidoreductase [Myxococcales bacterium]|nr:cyclic nucleotide-regulated FAD-dependent pyridine nucleotide-disulfide oxidoreductase [Myxococcales bacterium]